MGKKDKSESIPVAIKTSQGEFDKFSESSDNEEENKEKEKGEDKKD